MITGVSLGGRHCYSAFRLVMTDRKIGLPEVKKITVSVPGRDGDLDFTEVLDGHVHYGNRVIELTFTTFEPMSHMTWAELLREFAAYVHGRRMSIIFDDDPDYYYTGRAEISQYQLDKASTCQELTVSFDCEPYKLRAEESVYLYELSTVETTISINSGRKSVVPTIVVGTDSVISWQGSEYPVSAGTNVIDDIVFEYGANELTARTVSGTGTIAIRFQRGDL